jgi:hypothetical protein
VDSNRRTVVRQLQARGWLSASGGPIDVSPAVSQSLVIEAKVKDWRRGIGQLTRTRWAASRSALLMPHDRMRLVPTNQLIYNRLGLLTESDGDIRWQRKGGQSAPLTALAQLWLAELAARAFELSRY